MIQKYAEPTTLITDGLLGIQCLIFSVGAALLFFKFSKKKHILIWIGFWLSLGVSMFTGAVNHFTLSDKIYQITYKLTVICGEISLYFLHLSIPESFNTNFGNNWKIFSRNANLSFIGFLIFLISSGWQFIVVGFYLLYIFLQFLTIEGYYGFYPSAFSNSIRNYLIVSLFLGLVQASGKAMGWNIYYGSDKQYLFQVSNELFHLGMIIPNWTLYRKMKQFLIKERYQEISKVQG